MPVELLRVVLERRALEPSPLTYLMALAVGSLLGVLLHLAFGWRWWIVALGFVGATWLGFLLTAFGRRRGLATELLRVVSPRRARARRERQLEAIFRSPPMPLYGLGPSWTGRRFIGGIGGSDKEVTRLELAHGDPLESDSPEVRVEVVAEPEDPRRPPFKFVLHELARHVSYEANRPPPDLPVEEYPRWSFQSEREFEARGEPTTRPVSIPVDGKPVRFDAVVEGRAAGAVAGVNGLIVKVTTSNFPLESVELVTIEDTTPYIEGSRLLRQRDLEAPRAT